MNVVERPEKRAVFRFRIATLLWITLVISAFFAGRHWSGNAALVQLERAQGKQYSIACGKTINVTTKRAIPRMAIDSPHILKAQPISAREVQLLGRIPGDAKVIMWRDDGTSTEFSVKVK